MKRLYEVTCSFTYYAYTEGSADAIYCAEDAARDKVLFDTATVQEVKHRDHCLADDWDGTCLVYGTDEDMELREVLETLPLEMTNRGIK